MKKQKRVSFMKHRVVFDSMLQEAVDSRNGQI